MHYYNQLQEWLFLNYSKAHAGKKNLIMLRLCHIFSFPQENMYLLDVDKQ